MVAAIGSRGQTIRHHHLGFDLTGYALQLDKPALLAELRRIDVVADFRSRDLAAGGQGAPLVLAFHHAVFGRLEASKSMLNLGGTTNLSVLGRHQDVRAGAGATDGGGSASAFSGVDCGPGNALLDHWCQRHTGHAYDRVGAWGACGAVIEAFVFDLMAGPVLAKTPPKK